MSRSSMPRLAWALVGVALAGCGPDTAPPLTPQQFYPSTSSPAPTTTTQPAAPAEPARGADSRPVASDKPEFVPAAPLPATGPTTAVSSGQYMIVGAVIAEANGKPVYADKVLARLQPPLAVKARQLEPKQFREAAKDLIQKQVWENIRDELEFAAADRSSSDDDRKLAEAITVQWRQQQITQAGGSLAVARRKSLDDGVDFDDSVRQQYRVHVIQIYYQRKVMPRIQVTAEDMRRYYAKQLDHDFTEHDAVRFRLIKIGFKETGGRQQALDKINDLRKRALAGQDFATLAGEVNDDARLMQRKGDMDWIQKGALALEKVDQAVWPLRAGEITNVIEEKDAFYLARIDDRRVGRVMGFEEQSVQDRIRNTLRSEQFRALRDAEQARLQNSAVIRVDDKTMDIAVDMAMQRYGSWREGK